MKKHSGAKKWIEICVRVDGPSHPSVVEIFDRFGEGGAVTETICPSARSKQTTRVKTYLPAGLRANRRRKAILDHLKNLGKDFSISKPRIRTLTESDWVVGWQKHFRTQRIGNRIVIVPTWKKFTPRKNDVVVRMDPGMAFGTGLHPTTRLCLMALERKIRPGDRVLDIGTGSGIQAIAAAKLGAGHVTALDIEAAATEIAKKNIAINGIADGATILTGTFEKLKNQIALADLIVVNILAYTIIHMLPRLKENLRPGGWLIGGGILNEFRGDVERALSGAGFNRIEWLDEEDWLTFVANLAS